MERKCTDKWYLEKSVAELKNLDPESCPGSLPADYNTGTSRTTQNFKCFQKDWLRVCGLRCGQLS